MKVANFPKQITRVRLRSFFVRPLCFSISAPRRAVPRRAGHPLRAGWEWSCPHQVERTNHPRKKELYTEELSNKNNIAKRRPSE